MLNKNFWKVLVSLVLGVFLCVVFAACSEGHKHQLQEQAAVAATCTEAGHSEYWVCTGCDKIFSDAEGKNEIDPNTVIIPKTEHAGIEEVQLGIDADEGRGWVYHWYCADCGKYFADIFGDEEMTEDEVFFESIPSVTISLTGKKDGKSAAITQGNVTLQSTYDGIGSVSGTFSTTVTLQNVYPFISYKISCDNYTGSIVFEKGKTSYEAELLYETYKAAGANPGAVDLSHMADADAYVTISNKTDKVALAEMHGIENLGKSYYWEANVKIDAKAFSMWADRIIFVLSDGGTSGDEGLALWMTQATDQIHICRYKASNPEITYGGQGNDQTGADSCKAVTSGLFSESGLNVRVFRNANLMSLFYLNEQGEWSIFYSFNTCEGDAKIALGAMGTTGGGVIFSDIRVEKLTYHATTVSVGDTPAYLEHFTDSDNNCYTVKGDPVTLDDLVMHYSVEDAKDVDLTDNDMTYWMNMLYYEIYHPDGTGAKIIQMPGAVDLISSFTENMQFVSASGNDANAVMLDGTTRAHLKLDGRNPLPILKLPSATMQSILPFGWAHLRSISV